MINRIDRRSQLKCLQQCRDLLAANAPVLFFPEGGWGGGWVAGCRGAKVLSVCAGGGAGARPSEARRQRGARVKGRGRPRVRETGVGRYLAGGSGQQTGLLAPEGGLGGGGEVEKLCGARGRTTAWGRHKRRATALGLQARDLPTLSRGTALCWLGGLGTNT